MPVKIIKKIYGEKLKQEAESDAIAEIIEYAKRELDIKGEDIIGDPIFEKYEKNSDGSINVVMTLSLKPTINIEEEHSDISIDYEEPTVEEKEIDEKIEEILKDNLYFKDIKEDRALQNGDQAEFDFVGKVDGAEFEGGSAKNFKLVIGSGNFIDGFEEQMVGMKRGETKDINVKFPEDYHSKELAGKDAVFTVTLHNIQEEIKELDEEVAKRLLPNDENATVEKVKEQVKEYIKSDKIVQLYTEELKPKLVEILLERYEFDLPKNIVEQEIDEQVNQKAQMMSEDELAEYKDNSEKINELRESVREDAINSVKATFLIDALAKRENITVSDQELTQIIYREAILANRNVDEVMKYYKENNLLPAIKMSLIEDKLFYKMLGLNG